MIRIVFLDNMIFCYFKYFVYGTARSLHEWKELIGSDRQYLQMSVESHSGKDVSSPKHGKVDPTGDPHVGGNTWAGGTGGSCLIIFVFYFIFIIYRKNSLLIFSFFECMK